MDSGLSLPLFVSKWEVYVRTFLVLALTRGYVFEM